LFRALSFSKYSGRKNVEVKMSKSSPYCVLLKNVFIASYDVFYSDFAKLVMFQIFTSPTDNNGTEKNLRQREKGIQLGSCHRSGV
jgi:hypothetical protein